MTARLSSGQLVRNKALLWLNVQSLGHGSSYINVQLGKGCVMSV